jgi:pyridoxal 5'-phosphate synthase pdxT subunit
MKIGVLDIQGSVEEHVRSLKKIGVEVVYVKKPEDLKDIKGLIIPGGESTTIGKLMRRFGLRNEIEKRVKKGMCIWGTCAGAILLAKKIAGKQQADSLKLADIEIERNAYGRQIDSFETKIKFDFGDKNPNYKDVSAVFIRAPRIVKIGKGVKVLAKYKDEIVAARDGQFLVTTFHPELTDDTKVHEYFSKMSKCRN